MQVMQLLAAVQLGPYVNLWKILPVLLVLLCWARLLTWMDKDAVEAHLPRFALNTIMLVVLLLGFAAFLLLPTFPVAISVFSFMFVVDIGVYLVLRHQKVGLGDLKKQFGNWARSLTSRKPKEVKVAEGEVGLIAKGTSPIKPPDSESPDVIGYEGTQKLLGDPLRRHAEQIELVPQEGAATVRFVVDGVAHAGQSLTRDEAAAVVTYLKGLAGMDLADKRKPQSGKMKIVFGGKRHEMEIRTAGSTAGESLGAIIDPKKRHDRVLGDLGFAPDQLESVTETIRDGGGGIVLLSAPKGHGLRSLFYGVLRGHDAFLTHILTIERDPPLELEGITQNPLPGNAPGTEEARLADWVTSQEPDVVGISSVVDPLTALSLVKFAATGKRVYVGLRATSTFDALDQWRKLVGDDQQALKDLRLVINERLLRKLCMACKVGYSADPETLRKLNMSPEKVGKLFQARTQPLVDPKGRPLVCEFCQDMRFVGRMGVFEDFVIDDEVRQTIQAGGSTNQLKALFRKQRKKYIQEQALARVETGETSVQEVLRVLGSSSGTSGTGGKPGGAQPGGAGGKPGGAQPGGSPAGLPPKRPAPTAGGVRPPVRRPSA